MNAQKSWNFTSKNEANKSPVSNASKINQTGVQLKDISDKVEDSIVKIGEQIDQFKV